MSDVTQILFAIDQGDELAAEQLLPLVYDELRKLAAQKMAQEKPGQTLQATALVHEAYIRLMNGTSIQNWNSRGHFFAAAAEAMRRILVDGAREKQRHKRGGDFRRQDGQLPEAACENPANNVLAIHEALEKFEKEHAEKAELVKLRYFAGLTIEEAAEVLGLSTATVERHWRYSRAWLARELS